MSIKFRNFRRLGAGYKVTPVPDHLINKRASLHILEFGQFLIGGCICVNSLLVLFTDPRSNILTYSLLLGLGVLFVISAYLLAADSIWYRVSAVSCVLLSTIFALLVTKEMGTLIIFVPIILTVVFILFIQTSSKEYYRWVKSISQ